MPPYNNAFYNPYMQPMDNLSQLKAQHYQPMAGTQMSLPNQPPQTNQGLLWVSGEAGAKGYLVAPNTTVLLMDSEGSRFYLKSTDGAGMPSLRTFEYTEVAQNATHNAPQVPQKEEINLDEKYCTRSEYDDLLGKYEALLERIDSFPASVSVADTERKPQKSNSTRNRGGDSNE